MLFYKSWLETRWRFVSGLALLSWFLAQWLAFAARVRLALPRLTVEREGVRSHSTFRLRRRRMTRRANRARHPFVGPASCRR